MKDLQIEKIYDGSKENIKTFSRNKKIPKKGLGYLALGAIAYWFYKQLKG